MGFVSDNFPDVSFIDNCTIDDVITQMISDYQEKYKELTGREASLAQADPYRLIMYAAAIQIYQGMHYADNAGKQGLLKYSRGEKLDNLSALRSVERIRSTPAVTTLQFSIESTLTTVVAIPAGTRVTNGNDVFFATDEYAEIAAGQTSVSVPATCTESGAAGNGFAAGEFTTLVNTLPYITSVTNIEATTGGADTEDDDSLKDRVFNAPAAYSTAGSEAAYIYHVKSVDPTISDVVIPPVTEETAGIVTIYFVCDGGELPTDALISRVEDHLNEPNIRPLTDKVVVSAPTTQTYDVNLTYYIASSDKSAVSTIQADVTAAVNNYNAWQTEQIGRDINPDELIQRIKQAGAKRCVITSPVFTVISKDKIAKLGTVTLTYGGLEDD